MNTIRYEEIAAFPDARLEAELAFAEGFGPEAAAGAARWIEALRVEAEKRRRMAILLRDFHARTEGLNDDEVAELATFTVQRILGTYDYADTFETPYEQTAHLAGKPFEVVRVYEVETEGIVDQECTPLFLVRIDGHGEQWALPEEVLAGHWTGYPDSRRYPRTTSPGRNPHA